jgi:hypothetical protein
MPGLWSAVNRGKVTTGSLSSPGLRKSSRVLTTDLFTGLARRTCHCPI